MTIIEAVASIDAFKPNNYTQPEKVKWLSRLDGMIKTEIIDTHEGGEDIAFEGYTDETPEETVLIVAAPYDEVYIRWLEAQIDYANGEYGRYNNSMTMFNTSYSAFRNYWNRTHMPLGKQRKFF